MIIGITGGIGTGKSTVSSVLRDCGCTVIDADAIYKELVMPGMPLLQELTDAFGEDILYDDGSLNTVKLSQKALGTPLLNEITHSAISKEIFKRIDEAKTKDVYLDIPLLFEAGFDKHCDVIWMVTAKLETRIKRVMSRDGISEEEILRRINLQMSDEERAAKSDIIINNDCSREQLVPIVKDLINGKTN
ncbi:MAG: dephospho-CoA kinase [Bacillota bacterium]|nr:dephospho-CoA kinase [Bacillota bacterium]